MKSINSIFVIILLLAASVSFGQFENGRNGRDSRDDRDERYDRAPMNEMVKRRQMSGGSGERAREHRADVDRPQGEMTIEEMDVNYGYGSEGKYGTSSGVGGASYSGY